MNSITSPYPYNISVVVIMVPVVAKPPSCSSCASWFETIRGSESEQTQCVLLEDERADFVFDRDLLEIRHPAIGREHRVV